MHSGLQSVAVGHLQTRLITQAHVGNEIGCRNMDATSADVFDTKSEEDVVVQVSKVCVALVGPIYGGHVE